MLGGYFVIGGTAGLAQTPGPAEYAIFTLAGLAGEDGSIDGTGSAAWFNSPNGVAADSGGAVYVADTYNHTIRKLTAGGVVSTLAGRAGIPASEDGTGSAARFNLPNSVAVDSGGNVYVADTYNATIRKITPGGVVSTLAGYPGSSGGLDGTGSAARFNAPIGVAVDSGGNVYVADTSNHTIRKITPAAVVSTLAGRAGSWGSADGVGKEARFNGPQGVAVDGEGNVYVADSANDTVRKITPAGAVSTLAGQAVGWWGSADGTGSAAQFYQPNGVAVDSVGKLYIADTSNHTIRLGLLDRATPPEIAVDPADQQAVRGHWVRLQAFVVGARPLVYQWRKDGMDLRDGGPITGAQTPNLTIQDLKPQDAGSYQVTVSNALGIVVSKPAALSVRDPLVGDLRWVTRVVSATDSSPGAVAVGPEGTVYVAGLKGGPWMLSSYAVYALEAATGVSKSVASGGGSCRTLTIGEDGTVYLRFSGGTITATNGRNWDFVAGPSFDASSAAPAIGADGTIYVGAAEKVYALEGPTARPKWASAIGGYTVVNTAVGAQGTVYVGASDSRVYAFDGSTGDRKWMFKADAPPGFSPAIGADGTIYIVMGSNLCALDGFNGARKWVSAGDYNTPPVVGTDGAIVIGASNAIVALDGSTGNHKWRFDAGLRVSAAPSPAIAADGTIYVGRGTTLYALDGATGTNKWSANGSADFTAPALGIDGTIYIGTAYGKVYAFYGSAPLADSPWPMERHDPQHTGRATSLSLPSRLDRAALINGQFQLQWSGNGVLQSADEVQGPWQDLAATNGFYSTAAEGARGFFRLRSR